MIDRAARAIRAAADYATRADYAAARVAAARKLSGVGRSRAMAHYARQLTAVPTVDVPATIDYILEHTGLKSKDLYCLLGDPNDSAFRKMRRKGATGKNMGRAFRTISILLQLQELCRDEILEEHHAEQRKYPD